MTLPAVQLDEKAVIDHLAAQVAVILPKMNANYSLARLEQLLRERLRAGDFAITVKAVDAAEKESDWLADKILRTTFAEMDTKHQAMTDQLRAFGQRAAVRPPVVRGRGRSEHEQWSRNVGICTLIEFVCREYGVRATRSRSARRLHPCGCSLVAEALAANGILITERSIQDDIWFGLPGLLVRQASGNS